MNTDFINHALRSLLVALSLCAVGFTTPLSQLAYRTQEESAPETQVKNIILMISDGWGYNHIEAASYYRFGEAGSQVYTQFPYRFAMSTYSADGHGYNPELAWSYFDYVKTGATDSAAAATALSTGVRVRNRIVGLDVFGRPLRHICERAEELGMATGVVTSVPISHATPAGFIAHNSNRYNYLEIAEEMIVESAVDVIFGAGHPLFDNDGRPVAPPEDPEAYRYVGGEAIWSGLLAGTVGGDADGDGTPDPWTLIQTKGEFLALAEGPTPKRVLGVATINRTLQQRRSGVDDDLTDDLPYQAPPVENVPTLAEISLAALNVLDDDPDGFFLMIEGGAVDWANEDNQSGRMIEEQIDFDVAVEAVVRWIEEHSDWNETLLFVTGDHEAGYLTGPGSDPAWEPIVNNGRGNLPGMEWHVVDRHTNLLIPIFAKGDAARLLADYADQHDPVRGPYIDITEVAQLIFRLLVRP